MNAWLLQAPRELLVYLLVAAVLAALGVATCLWRRNAVGWLIGVELLINAGILNLLAFARARDDAAAGQAMAVVVIALAAAEAVVALALLYAAYTASGDVAIGPAAADGGTVEDAP
jgi:NADH-quinone oxidoreductase subunit K